MTFRLSPPFEHPSAFGRDESNPYYDFLAHLVQASKAKLVVELGTCTGRSTSYFASAGASRVVSIDIEQQASVREALKPFANVELWERDTAVRISWMTFANLAPSTSSSSIPSA